MVDLLLKNPGSVARLSGMADDFRRHDEHMKNCIATSNTVWFILIGMSRMGKKEKKLIHFDSEQFNKTVQRYIKGTVFFDTRLEQKSWSIDY